MSVRDDDSVLSVSGCPCYRAPIAVLVQDRAARADAIAGRERVARDLGFDKQAGWMLSPQPTVSVTSAITIERIAPPVLDDTPLSRHAAGISK